MVQYVRNGERNRRLGQYYTLLIHHTRVWYKDLLTNANSLHIIFEQVRKY